MFLKTVALIVVVVVVAPIAYVILTQCLIAAPLLTLSACVLAMGTVVVVAVKVK